jgi:hypothetical protein
VSNGLEALSSTSISLEVDLISHAGTILWRWYIRLKMSCFPQVSGTCFFTKLWNRRCRHLDLAIYQNSSRAKVCTMGSSAALLTIAKESIALGLQSRMKHPWATRVHPLGQFLKRTQKLLIATRWKRNCCRNKTENPSSPYPRALY